MSTAITSMVPLRWTLSDINPINGHKRVTIREDKAMSSPDSTRVKPKQYLKSMLMFAKKGINVE